MTVVFSTTDTADANNQGGFTFAQIIDTANLTADTTDNQLRITLKFTAATMAGSMIDEVWVGPQATSGNVYNFDGTQVQIKFSGNNSYTLAGTGTIQTVVSDWIPYSVYTASRKLIVRSHYSGTVGVRLSSSLSGQDLWYLAGASQAGTTAPTGTWANTGSGTYAVMQIEMQHFVPPSGLAAFGRRR
jgi:hypothetical protein